MKIIILFGAIFCMLVLFIVGCSGDGDDVVNDVPGTDIYPLAVGNSWTYMQYYYNADGGITDSTEGTITVVGTDEINNESVFLVEDLHGDTLSMGGGDAGLWVYPESGYSQLYIPYPASVDDSVIFTFDNGTTWSSCVLVSINETVYLNMGTYVCWKYKETPYSDPAHVYYHYFYQDIGLVQQDDWRMDVNPAYMERRMKLTGYTLD